MSTSGVQTWELQSTALVTAAYRKLGYISEGQSLSTTALANGVEQLNAVLTLLQTKGMPLWKRTTQTITLISGTSTYSLTSLLKLSEVSVYTTATGTQWDMVEKSLYDFNNLPALSTGIPVHYTFQPSISDGTLTIWPIPDTAAAAAYTLKAIYQKKFDNMISSTDTVDFPSYWQYAIIFKLAVALAPETGLPLQDRASIKMEAEEAIKMASDYGDEDGSLFVSPSMQ